MQTAFVLGSSSSPSYDRNEKQNQSYKPFNINILGYFLARNRGTGWGVEQLPIMAKRVPSEVLHGLPPMEGLL